MLAIDERTITDAALEQMANTPDPRLREIMAALVRHLHDFAREVDLTPEEWLEGIKSIGVTAGASAPEHLVEQIVAALNEKGFGDLEEVEMVEEDVRFSLPPELAGASSQLYGISAPSR